MMKVRSSIPNALKCCFQEVCGMGSSSQRGLMELGIVVWHHYHSWYVVLCLDEFP